MLVRMESQPSKERNRVVLVTGGAIRLGAAISEALAKRGWNVVIHAHGSGPAADALCERLRGYGINAWRVTADLTRPHAAKDLFDAARTQAGRLDALVNNAALFSLMKELSAEERDRLLNVNTDGPIQLTYALFEHLRERQARGSVVNLLDQRIARVAMETATPYEQSKLLLARATRSDAIACAPVLRVNAVAPGAILSPTATDAREPAGAFPLGRRPTPGDVALAVCWLLEAEAVTGQTLYVDGGQHLA